MTAGMPAEALKRFGFRLHSISSDRRSVSILLSAIIPECRRRGAAREPCRPHPHQLIQRVSPQALEGPPQIVHPFYHQSPVTHASPPACSFFCPASMRQVCGGMPYCGLARRWSFEIGDVPASHGLLRLAPRIRTDARGRFRSLARKDSASAGAAMMAN
jgi:hypothetical protein